jgi:DinB superfamily
MENRDTGGMAGAQEGWDWVQIQREACPECGQHPGALPPQRLGGLAISSAALWRAFLEKADDESIRASPSAEVWSPIQYGAHVRDMLRIFGDRILLAVAEENPSVPWFDPGPEGWAAYNRMAVSELASDIAEEAQRFSEIIDDRSEADWSRTAMRDGEDPFTVGGLACFGVHEAHHHLLDVTGGIAATA